MRGRRRETDPSFNVSRLTFHGFWKRAEHDAGGRRSFAGVERSMSDRLLRTPECLPIFLPDLQCSKHIDRKTSRYLSLGFVPHDLFVQNKRHGF